MAPLSVRTRQLLRHTTLSALGAGYVLSGRYRSLATRPRVQVLLYHHVRPEWLSRFRESLQMLTRHARFISYSQAVELIRGGRIDQPCLAITFDDGFQSCIEAANVMAQMGISACFFVNPSSIGLTDPRAVEQFNRERLMCETRDFMMWKDVEGLLGRGHEIGSHTMTHLNLGQASADQVTDELIQSRDELKRRVGGVEHFAWPYGHFDHFSAAAAKAVFAAGYSSCASGQRGSHAPSETPASVPPCIRRDHCMANWPIHHIKYFVARNARHPIDAEHSWPDDWSSVISREFHHGAFAMAGQQDGDGRRL